MTLEELRGEINFLLTEIFDGGGCLNMEEAGPVHQTINRLGTFADNPWQPIETVPKDGTLVLLKVRRREEDSRFIDDLAPGDEAVTIGCNSSEINDLNWQIVGYDMCHDYFLSGDGDYVLEGEPVAWMPLPNP